MPKSPVTDGNRLFIVGLDGVIYSLNVLSGRVNWKLKLPATPSTGLALRDKTIYVGTNDQRLYRLNAETGAVVSELATEAKPVGRLAFANDSLFLFLQNASERAGYIISVEPGLTYTFKKVNLYAYVPVAVKRSRAQSVPDKVQTQITGVYAQGDAAFADYLVNVGFIVRF